MCKCKTKPSPPRIKGYPPLGALILLEYKGDQPQAIYGEVTNTRYPFDERKVVFVDIGDAVFLLGKDYVSH